LTLKRASYLFVVVVQASPISRQCSTGWGCDQYSKRCDAILSWHFLASRSVEPA
jgi:hypothetical protein